MEQSYLIQLLTRLILSTSWNVQLVSGCPLADPQQFFTGKLYVLVYQLKLPAEELLWLALSWHPSLE
ncbi:hypothetical protein KOW79_014770 [Hemibagrus wyckioides]|uniref:Secreted protein n=1 Tax=Hemibagrus wyckioides TaxID=337641 RepID=A0A9D3NGM2_9TELE|nr:hypothetical protein KOW79_014770 [Hemibagrus wyckioides]